MKIILILLGVLGSLCVFADAAPMKKIVWSLASDFNETELTGLSPEQEHELHLKSLSQKDPITVSYALHLELIAKSVGNNAFGFAADETTNQENVAVAKATFDCFTKLHLQDRVMKLIYTACQSAATSMNKTGSTLSNAFSLACSKIDAGLRNESIYTTLKDEYKKESLTPPKTYLYGIAKSEKDLRKAVAEIFNDPQMKKRSIYLSAYSSLVNLEEERVLRQFILQLANEPAKLESVDKIYEQCVAEVIPQMEDVKPSDVYVDVKRSPLIIDFPGNINPILGEKLMSKIEENSMLKDDFEKMHFHRSAMEKIGWLLASDFNETELSGLSPEQEHELHLKSLSQKGPIIVKIALAFELIAKSVGNNFFGFPTNETTNQENVAVAKATFDCLAKLHLQDRVMNVTEKAVKSAATSMNETGSTLGSAFSLACSKIDDALKNESIYTSLKEEYKKESLTPPKKTYLYGIAKSEKDLRKAFAELFNDPQMNKRTVHLTAYTSLINRGEGIALRQSILELANQPGKSESVDKIYEQCVAEVIPQMEDVKLWNVNVGGEKVPIFIDLIQDDMRFILSEKLVSKIKENSMLKDDFEKIHRSRKCEYEYGYAC